VFPKQPERTLALAVLGVCVAVQGLVSCVGWYSTNSCVDWLKAQPEVHLVYPGGIVIPSLGEFDEAATGPVHYHDPSALVYIFVPGGDQHRIMNWYAQQLTRRGWSPPDRLGVWRRSSGMQTTSDLSFSVAVDNIAPGTTTPPTQEPGEWVSFGYSIAPLSGTIQDRTAKYVCS
jgi:hypothetical protein